MKQNFTLPKLCTAIVAAYFFLAALVYFIAGDVFRYKVSENSVMMPEAIAPVGEIIAGSEIEQRFTPKTDNLYEISIKAATYGRQNYGTLSVLLKSADDGTELYRTSLDMAGLKDNSDLTFKFPQRIEGVNNRVLALIISSDSTSASNAVTVYGNPDVIPEGGSLAIGGKPRDGSLAFSAIGYRPRIFGKIYFPVILAAGAILIIYFVYLCRCAKKGKSSIVLTTFNAYQSYKFLLHQLVSRDFKTKYKRSVLGVLWSFLNPLLTMAVQYVVFSSLFRFNVDNFLVYLLVGIVLFNFFSEATTMALSSIVSNAPLITKVYIPKYIFPVSRVMSSTINLLFSLIPLVLVILITGITPSISMLLFPFGIVCLILFSAGAGMFLAAVYVFFRDTQFLWSVITMLWMYATPIIYPENILPDRFSFILKLNPLYYIIKFSRTVIMDGVSPEPSLYLMCFAVSMLTLVAGSLIFRAAQNKFVLYI